MSFQRIIKIIFSSIILVGVLGAGVVSYACYLLSDDSLRENTEKYLESALGTNVYLKSVRLQPFKNSVAIYGFDIKDKKNISMLHVDTLEANVDLWQLMDNNVTVKGFKLAGAYAILYRERPDTATNYQFVIDALKFKGNEKQKKQDDSSGKKAKITVDLRSVVISRTGVRWDIHSKQHLNTRTHKEMDMNHLWIDGLDAKVSLKSGGSPGDFTGVLKHFKVRERNSNSHVTIDDVRFNGKKQKASIGEIAVSYQDKVAKVTGVEARIDNKDVGFFSIKNFYFHTDNGKKRKNVGKPNRGAFDPGHMDLNASLRLVLTSYTPDSIAGRIVHLVGEDVGSSLKLTQLNCDFVLANKVLNVSDLSILTGQTSISIPQIVALLPRYAKDPRPLSYKAPTMTARVILSDIATPFAPALAKFSTPLYVSCAISGDKSKLLFKDIIVRSRCQRLMIKANGGLYDLDKKKKLVVAFDVNEMYSREGMTRQIVQHFKTKPAMLGLIDLAGNVGFKGKVIIPYRKQIFRGTVNTAVGTLYADILLDSSTKYMTGYAKSDSINVGRLASNPSIGSVGIDAKFSFDISSKKAAKKMGRKKGKLPAGYLRGEAKNLKYKMIKVPVLEFDITSNADVARGNVTARTKYVDIDVDFSFEDTYLNKSLKYKPRICFHNGLSSGKDKNKEKVKDKDTPRKNNAITKAKDKLKKLFSKKKSTPSDAVEQ